MTYISSIEMACIWEPAYNGPTTETIFPLKARFF